jgi:hypothetical protein
VFVRKCQDTGIHFSRGRDTVFGPDIEGVADTTARSPGILNQSLYTTAGIKETPRLYPPVGSIRKAPRHFFLLHPETGTKLLMEG